MTLFPRLQRGVPFPPASDARALVVALLHLYVAGRLAPDLPGPWVVAVLVGLLLLSALLVPAAFARRRWRDRAVADRWAWNLCVRLQQPFAAGLHRLRGLWVYTSRCTGDWGPPLRLGAPSEITRLRVMTAAS